MKRVLKVTWVTACIIILVLYFLACLTPFIPTTTFALLSLLSLAFPFLLAASIFCALGFLLIKKGIAFLMLLAIFLAGAKNIHSTFALNNTHWQMQKQAGNLRVMTWNCEFFLNFWPANTPEAKPRLAMYEAIKKYNPDILCLQEFRDAIGPSYTCISNEVKALGYKYSFVSNDSIVTRFAPNIIYSGVAVFSKLPFVDSARINIRKKEVNENLVYTDVLYNNIPLRIFTGHLASLNLYIDTIGETTPQESIYETTYKIKSTVASRFEEGEKLHQHEVAFIKNQLQASPYPYIYCGDNNATPASYTYHFFKGTLQDAFVEKGFGLGGTFYKISPTLRIDVCFVHNALQVQQVTVPQVYLSDHFPVVTDISLK